MKKQYRSNDFAINFSSEPFLPDFPADTADFRRFLPLSDKFRALLRHLREKLSERGFMG